ncbi:choice-of-anchor J domain-containing protein [uncultured Muribaculum sp.]|nr:choice-of-anchor J domain-containing protein [uncultured Muribaculum sp.]
MSLTGVAHAVASLTPTLYGNLIYTRSWGDEDATNAGIYKFLAEENPVVTLEYHPGATNIYANGGAVYVDGKYYVLTHVPNTGKIQKNTMYAYDADSWTLLSQTDIPLTTTASDLTWCPVDNKVYGVFLNPSGSGFVFGTLNLSDGTVAEIKDIDLREGSAPMAFIALAADDDGDIFGVASTGDLYRFDRATGDHILVGPTGFVPARWNQSGCFDFTTKEMYWAACNADLSALFRIDTATGAATRVCTFKNDEEFTGLYSRSSVADLKGPQAVEMLSVNLEGNSLSGTVAFTMPTATIAGDKITATLRYVVEDDGKETMTGEAAPGASVSRDVTFAEGLHCLTVYAVSSDGRGAQSRISVYAGDDVPASPASVSAKKSADAVVVSWDAVSAGANGGHVDPAAITYTVTRMPDGKTVAADIPATSCTDVALPSLLGDYRYHVAASYAGKHGTAAISAPLTLGTTFSAPLLLDFTDEEQFKFCTVIDANADGKTWTWSINGVRCDYHRTNNTDDWIITPPIEFKGGCRYTIEVVARSSTARYEEHFEVKAGTSPSAADMTIPVLGSTVLTTGNNETSSTVFIPEADGTYHLGIHGISEKYMSGIYMYSIRVSEPVAGGAPAAPADMFVNAAPMGAIEATVSSVAPAEAVDGSTLETLVKAELTNLTTGNFIGSVDNPVPGQTVSITDKSPIHGMNEYSMVFYSAAGKGYASIASAYVGLDTPAPVSDVMLRQQGSSAILTWEAPAVGANGGYIAPESITYRVALASNSADIARDLPGCSYTDESRPVEVQQVLQYIVFASNATGSSTGTRSNSITFGNAYAAPFAESFAGGKETMSPWVTVQEGPDYPSWTPTTKGYDGIDYSQDGDLGWVKYSSKGTISLVSPVIDLTTLKSPVLKFWMNSPEGPIAFDVSVSPDRGVSWETVKSMSAECAEWQCVSIDLTRFKSSDCFQVRFRASSQEYIDMMLDNIRIADMHNVDLGIVSFSGPTKVVGGTSATYSVKLLNDGVAAASDYVINLSGEGRILASGRGEAVASDAFITVPVDVTFPVNVTDIELKAEVVIDGDELASNNESMMSVHVDTPRLPAISTLAAAVERDAVRLTWEHAAEERNPGAFTDDLESFTAWDFGGVTADNPAGSIGDYMMYDADRKSTVVASSWFMQPNANAPMAFQVAHVGTYPELDLSRLGVNARSGKNSFVAWGANEGESSDWLILPQLFPGETTISFWAHSAAVSFGQIRPEKIQVLYSSTGTSIDDFTPYGEPMDVPAGFESDPEKGFVRYEVTLPDDAKYAAIRASLSTQDNKGIVIDDISFTPATAPMEKIEIKGYNIYRDGVWLATTDGEEYVDATSDGSHVYNVTTLYHVGESPFSNDVVVSTSGIDGITADGLEGEPIYYNLQGVEVKAPVKGNVYIVRFPDGTSSKRILR